MAGAGVGGWNGLTAAILIWRMRAGARRVLSRRARIGLVAGVVATLAYDAVRWLLVVATPWTVDPFAAFPQFGQLLIGTGASGPAVWTAGTLFHAANGLGFAVGYTRLADQRDVWNAHDYVAALVIRRLTERGLDQLDSDLRTRAGGAVRRFDDQRRALTEPDARGLLRRFAAEDAGNEWWWERIPTSGPVRDDLLAFAARVGA